MLLVSVILNWNKFTLFVTKRHSLPSAKQNIGMNFDQVFRVPSSHKSQFRGKFFKLRLIKMKDEDSSPSEEEDSEQEELVKELEALEADNLYHDFGSDAVFDRFVLKSFFSEKFEN